MKGYKVTRLQGYKVNAVAEQAPAAAPFETFESLEAYQVAREFRKAMYAIARRLPDFEKYVLGSQIRRAAISLTNNIAEGHGRFHYPDQIRFMLQARGSLEELMDDLTVCEDESYLSVEEVRKHQQIALTALRLLNGYIRYLRSKLRPDALREDPVNYICDDVTM